MLSKSNFHKHLYYFIAGSLITAFFVLTLTHCHREDLTPYKKIVINNKKYEVIKEHHDTVIVTKTQTKYLKGDTITRIVIKNKLPLDTVLALREFNIKSVYFDTLKLSDSLGTVSIIDTVFQNKIQSRKWDSKIQSRTISSMIYLKDPESLDLYVGPAIMVSNTNVNLGAVLNLKTKQGTMYHGSIAVSPINKNLQIGLGVSWKIF